MAKRVLVAFDFDHTLIDENSDTYVVRRLAPNGGKVPSHITQLYSVSGWTKYMEAIFKYLHENGTTAEQLLTCLREIQLVDGMHKLLAHLGRTRGNAALVDSMAEGGGRQPSTFVEYESIIISDANSVFIDQILWSARIDRRMFSAVYTNPADFDTASGRLHVTPYHTQHWCDLSTANLCKGHILDDHRSKYAVKRPTKCGANDDYDVIAYVGDGSNDFCPSLRLRSCDYVFPRRGFPLARQIAEQKGRVAAKVVPWDSGLEILDTLRKNLE